MRNLLCVVALTLSVGCAKAIVRPYIGDQQNWPTSLGAIANTKYQLPVFTSLPPAPYEVIGELRIESPFHAQPEEGHLPVMIKKAIELNADALVLVSGGTFFSNNYGVRPTELPPTELTNAAPVTATAVKAPTNVNKFNPITFKPDVSVIAIRWIGIPPLGAEPKLNGATVSDLRATTVPSESAPKMDEPATPTVPDAPPAGQPESPVPPPAPETPKAEEPPPAPAPEKPAIPEPPAATAPAPAQ
jgi:hypothetical protein